MKKSKFENSLYGKYKEERQSYRLAQDLKKHNWLIQKFKSIDTKPTKREKNILKRLRKNIMKSRAKVVIPRIATKSKTPEIGSSDTKSVSPKLNSNNKIGKKPMASQSMPNITDSYNEEKIYFENSIGNISHQEEPLALVHKPENRINNSDTNKTALLNQSGKNQSLHENKSKKSVIGNIEERNNKSGVISVQPAKNNSLMDNMTQYFIKHHLPVSAVPEMKKYRQAMLPSDLKPYSPAKDCKNCESQTDGINYMEMLQFLQAQKITSIEKLKNIVENYIEEEDYKTLEYLKAKKITLHKLIEIISKDNNKEKIDDDDVILKEINTEDDVEFVKIETPPQNKVSSKSVDALIALSAENKKLIYLYTKYKQSCKPEGMLIQYKLDETPKNQRNQSVISQAPSSISETTITKPMGVQQEHSYNYNDVVEADPIAEDDDRLVIDEINKTVSSSTYLGNQIAQDICNKMVENYCHHGSELVEDIASEVKEYTHIHVAQDTYCQATEDSTNHVVEETSSNVVNLIEQQPENIGLYVEEEPSHLSFQEAESQAALEPNTTSLAASNAFKVPTNIKMDPSFRRTPYTRRGRSQMGASGVDVQKMTPRQENKRHYHRRDPKIKCRQQPFAKPQSFNHHGSQVPPRFLLPNMPLRQIRPRAFKNIAAANSVNPNLGFDRNSHIGSNGPYHPSNQSNNIVCSTDNQYGLYHLTGLNNLTNTQCNQNDQNDSNSGLAPNSQFANEANPQNHYSRIVKSYGTSGQNYNVIYNPNNQSGGTWTHNSQAGSLNRFAQIDKPGLGGFGQQSHDNVHSSLTVNDLGDQENNVFWDQTGQNMPATTIANIVDQPLQWPATSMRNLTGFTGVNQSLYPPPRQSPIAAQYANTTPESLWHTRRWAQQ